MSISPDFNIQAEAPGKFIISGEYSVVFGKPAIATAIDAKTKVTLRPCAIERVKLNLNDLGCTLEWDLSILEGVKLIADSTQSFVFREELVKVIERNIINHTSKCYRDSPDSSTNDEKKLRDSSIAFLLIYLAMGDYYDASKRKAIEVTIESTIPVGSGLGSSSAYSVGLIGAMNKLYKDPLDTQMINQWAFNIDKYFHGNPSGVDNSVITYGGYILFKSGEIISRANQIPAIQVMLIDSRVSRSTKTMGAKLKTERESSSLRTDKLFEDISQITWKLWQLMTDERNNPLNPRDLDELLSINHKLLEDLGVGHEKLTDIKQLAKEHGFMAKLSGAGCGGGSFILYRPDTELKEIDILRCKMEEAGYAVRLCPVGCQGLSVIYRD